MDRNTQRDEMRKAGAAPDIMVNSAHAVTERGQIVMTSATGSQIGPIAYGAGKLILVIGSQKVVPDLDTALRRIEDYVIPYEEDRLNVAHGVAKMNRTLILEGDHTPGRTTIILVRTPIGV
jgi:acyl-CoA hydrolase